MFEVIFRSRAGWNEASVPAALASAANDEAALGYDLDEGQPYFEVAISPEGPRRCHELSPAARFADLGFSMLEPHLVGDAVLRELSNQHLGAELGNSLPLSKPAEGAARQLFPKRGRYRPVLIEDFAKLEGPPIEPCPPIRPSTSPVLSIRHIRRL